MSAPKNKEKRIDKELFLLRNLPKDYKLGKKETQLGTLLDVSKKHLIFHNCYQMQLEISRSAVKSQFLDKTIERFYFDILLRDKYPFQPPIIMTRTTVSTSTQYFLIGPVFLQFCSPSLADGRDLLYQIIPKDYKKEEQKSED